jgi:hypothetical protein
VPRRQQQQLGPARRRAIRLRRRRPDLGAALGRRRLPMAWTAAAAPDRPRCRRALPGALGHAQAGGASAVVASDPAASAG